MTLSKKRILQRCAAMAHQAIALGSLLALMILVPTRESQRGLGSRFREPNRVPVKVLPMPQTQATPHSQLAKTQKAAIGQHGQQQRVR